MPDNAPNTQQADSFDDMYNVAAGMKTEFDNAFAKWAKKKGIQTGFPIQRRLNQEFVSEANRKKK